MENLISNLLSIIGNPETLLVVESIFLIMKLLLLINLILKHGSIKKNKNFYFLLFILISAMVEDLAWILKLSKELYTPKINPKIIIFFINISWGFAIIKYHYLGKFISNIANHKKYYFKIFENAAFAASLFFSAYFIFSAVLINNNISYYAKTITSIILLPFLIIPHLIFAIYTAKKERFPKLLKHQLKIIAVYLILPYVALEYSQAIPRYIFKLQSYIFTITSIATMLITFFMFYAIKKIILLRFLNLTNHVKSHYNFTFFESFKNVLEQLSLITNIKEFNYATQAFFKENFDIHESKVNLYLIEDFLTNDIFNNKNNLLVKNFFNKEIKIPKILIYDEIEFNNLYEKNKLNQNLLIFLRKLNADIFVPIYENQKLSAYIVVKQESRPKCFSNIEVDEILIFAKYLENIIPLLKNKKLNHLVHQEKDIKEELNKKRNEIKQYRESLRSLIKNITKDGIGILIYANNKLKIINKEADEIVNPYIIKEVKDIIEITKSYKKQHKKIIKGSRGEKLLITATPNSIENSLFITIYKLKIANIISEKNIKINDPTKWDYLLNLETTKSGKLINKLIPGNGEKLLNFKIELLKTALNEKAILLKMPKEDILATVDIIHTISLRKKLYIINLEKPSQNFDLAINLFGINPIFGIKSEQPLLEKLIGNNTLFINNIHFLDLETQKYLAEFIQSGFFRRFKDNKKIESDVRIICSTDQDLKTLVQNNKFSELLFNELSQTTLSMPSLLTLSQKEIDKLADGFAKTLLNEPELTNKEKENLSKKMPLSLYKFKNKIQRIIDEKNQKKYHNEISIYSNDLKVSHAIKLGKKALRDKEVMKFLWDKFKNQNKIAELLGVNRSSINRRCKQYDLK